MITAYSAKQTDKGHTSWEFNKAGHWNGGGMHHSSRYGYGLIDTHAMTRLAESWVSQSTLENEANIGGTIKRSFDIPDNGSITKTINLSYKRAINLTDAELRVKIKHPRIGDLKIELISPSGTVSTLLDTPENGDFVGWKDSDGNILLPINELDFTFNSVKFMGEKANGKWQVRITDTARGENGSIEMLDLQLYGNRHSRNSLYVYTDEFANLAQPGQRDILNDKDGGNDILNASPVTGDTHIDLGGGSSMIAGKPVFITAHTIETVFTGDGNDFIAGSRKTDNIFSPGRGDDFVDAQGGKNNFYYRMGDGHDIYLPSSQGQDKIFLLKGATADNTYLQREGTGIYITFDSHAGSIFIGNFFRNGSPNRTVSLQFSNGGYLQLNKDTVDELSETKQKARDIGNRAIKTQPRHRFPNFL